MNVTLAPGATNATASIEKSRSTNILWGAGAGYPSISKLSIILGFLPIRQDLVILGNAIEVPTHPLQLPPVSWANTDEQNMVAFILDLQIGMCFQNHPVPFACDAGDVFQLGWQLGICAIHLMGEKSPG